MHTKEPWSTTKAKPRKVHADGVLICTALIRNMATTAQNRHGKGAEEAIANAARIVSCVNAAAGIPDPAAYRAAFDAMEKALVYIASGASDNSEKDAARALTAARIARGDAA